MIKVDKGIPIPPQIRAGGRASKYPFKNMDIGDSVFIAGAKIGRFNSHTNVAKRLGFKFCARTVEGGIRIWRIA